MENHRWQPGPTRERVEIGRIDFPVKPFTKTEALLFSLFDRAVADAVYAMVLIGQHPDEVTTDEAIGTGDPDGQGSTLWQTNERERFKQVLSG